MQRLTLLESLIVDRHLPLVDSLDRHNLLLICYDAVEKLVANFEGVPVPPQCTDFAIQVSSVRNPPFIMMGGNEFGDTGNRCREFECLGVHLTSCLPVCHDLAAQKECPGKRDQLLGRHHEQPLHVGQVCCLLLQVGEDFLRSNLRASSPSSSCTK